MSDELKNQACPVCNTTWTANEVLPRPVCQPDRAGYLCDVLFKAPELAPIRKRLSMHELRTIAQVLDAAWNRRSPTGGQEAEDAA